METIPQQETLLSALNESQRAAVEYCEGPSLVIAGAGSGKTRVLTYKIAYLLAGGMEPWNILALTFTNKAAREMKERIGQLVGRNRANRLFMGTFHSVFSRILRREAGHVGFGSNFTIYDESDSRSLLKSIIKGLGLDEKTYKPAVVHGHISMAKNHLINAEEYAGDRAALERDRNARMPSVAQIYQAYQARCRQANAMDFDDLLLYTFILLRDHPDVRARYARNFRYILVDEYQDTNFAQVAIVRLLAEVHRCVCVVGDDYQSIYSFRGANIDNILDFKNKFEEARLFKLERNYRSTRLIVQAANSLMKHNERQIPKEVYSKEDEGDRLLYKPCYSDKEEAMVVVKEIQRIKRLDGCGYDDFAILYRTNAQSRSFEDEMRKNAIPYKIYGGLSFYQRKEIKDIIAYFRLVANPDDEEAFRRIINYPARGIGNATVQKLIECAESNSVSLWEVLQEPERYGLEVNKGTLAKLQGFRELITGYIRRLPKMDAYELGKDIIKSSGISADIFSGSDPDDLSRQENLDEFLSALQAFVEGNREEGREEETYLTDYLQEVALYSDLDKKDDNTPKVTLMTIHAAKGLEFPTVFVVGLEENIFPSPMSATSKRELEEERRLLYVAITRAERHCILTNAKNRFRYGTMQFDNPSRFLNDIDPRFLHTDDEAASFSSSTPHGRMPWDDGDNFREYEPDKAYTGSRPWGQEYRKTGSRWQNSNPVASQFRADPQPKLTERKRPEQAVNPLSERTKQRLLSEGGNFRRISSAIANGGRTMATASASSSSSAASFNGLYEGATIEHQRFGIGTVERLEGAGENAKATVAFRNAGTKQLLLKFAKYKILS
ncbi:ATP-dependent helicase [Prevotella dentasini]|uniref:ATP-dependent helicase n=1 Tax=Prevotella dentasini TaxID=589537 RepID=UPI0004694FF0|nr:UvrD-helicase domain-containing protein [Prevotella dentasini]